MDVTKLVQEETLVEPLALMEKNRPAKCKPGHVSGAERPTAYAQRKSTNAELRVEELGKPLRQFPR
jgi:hypothetical protein